MSLTILKRCEGAPHSKTLCAKCGNTHPVSRSFGSAHASSRRFSKTIQSKMPSLSYVMKKQLVHSVSFIPS
jgi:hypothetical protein